MEAIHTTEHLINIDHKTTLKYSHFYEFPYPKMNMISFKNLLTFMEGSL